MQLKYLFQVEFVLVFSLRVASPRPDERFGRPIYGCHRQHSWCRQSATQRPTGYRFNMTTILDLYAIGWRQHRSNAHRWKAFSGFGSNEGKPFILNGELAGTRTQDPRLKRALLYQLSYELVQGRSFKTTTEPNDAAEGRRVAWGPDELEKGRSSKHRDRSSELKSLSNRIPKLTNSLTGSK